MKQVCYGIFVGAMAVYVYVIHGALISTTFASTMSWRDSARTSVYGYGGTAAKAAKTARR